MRDRAFRNLVMAAVFAATVAPSTRGLAQEPLGAMAFSDCAQLMAQHVDKQANPRAGRLSVACRAAEFPYYTPEAPLTGRTVSAAAAASLIGGSDLNLVTGTETYPAVTQAGSMVWGNGADVVTVYNDTKDAPASFSGMSVSTDGGTTFDRLDPDPFGLVFTNDFGSPAVTYDDQGGKWLAINLTDCSSGQGIGLMSTATPDTPTSWAAEACPHDGVADDRPTIWIDNNSSLGSYGRRYISFNDFNDGGALKMVYWNGTNWNLVTVAGSFIRNVHITGDPADGTVYIFGMDEGGGADNPRQTVVYRSEDGGVTWTTARQVGNAFTPAGSGLCGGSDYFYMIPPVWRYMGWGQGAVGPDGVVHYVYSGAGAPGDPGDIFYFRSTDNGENWNSTTLNTDQLAQNNVVQWQPSISVTSQGYVLAAWYDRRETTDGLDYKYYGRLSLDNGVTFLPEEPIADVDIPQPTQVDPNTDFCFSGDSNFHASLGNDALVTWTDGRNAVSDGTLVVSQMDVYFDRVPLCPEIALSPTALPNGQVNAAYDEALSASGGTVPYTFSLSGSLPDGLGLNDVTEAIDGTPTAPGITPFTIIATDSLGCEGSQDYNLVVDPDAVCPTISLDPVTLPDGTQGAPYTATVTATDGTAPYSYAVTSGKLPAGLALDVATGEISGTSEESGSLASAFTFEITTTDANGCTGTQPYSLNIDCPPITLSPDRQLPDAFVGVPYLTNVIASGGTEPYTYDRVGGTLHNGLFTTSGGTLYGVIEGPGTKQPRVQATDVNGCTGDKQFRVDSVACFPGSILCDDMGDVTANFTAMDLCGGDAGWDDASACPSSDDIGHSATSHARWGTTAVCNDYGTVATQDSLDSVSMDASNCNSGEVILRFNYLISFEDDSDKDRARVEVIADGGAPEVVADNGAGGPACSGLASPGIGNLRKWSGWQHIELAVPATSTFAVSFIGETDDGVNNSGEGFFVDDVNVQCKCSEGMALLPDPLPDAIAGTTYSVTLETIDGAPPYEYSTLPGNPPPVNLDSATGVLSGTPNTAGIHEFTVVSTDSNFCKVSNLYNLIVSPPGCSEIALTPDVLPDATPGTFYSEVLTASGIDPHVWFVTAGDLPAGLALNTDLGVISGTPDTPGVSFFTISAVDSTFCVGSQEYTVINNPVGCPVIDVSPTVLPNAGKDVPYSETLTASGGVAPYVWDIALGALPAGLTLDLATGEISGTPTSNDVFSFAVTVQDANGCFGFGSYDIDVAGAPATYDPATKILSIPEVQVGASKAYGVELIRLDETGYVFEMINFKKTAPSTSPSATYDVKTGLLDIPVVQVIGRNPTWNVQMLKRQGVYVFNLTKARKNR